MVPKLIFLLYLCFLFNIIFSSHATAQEESSALRDIHAYLAESLPEAEDISQLTSSLSFFRKHPLELNSCTAAQLKELVFLSALQISNFFRYLKISGKLKDLLELQSIDGFDLETITRLLPYVTLRKEGGLEQLSLRNVWRKGSHELLFRYGRIIEQQKGFRDLPGNRYSGTADRILLSYKYSFGKTLFISMLGEKDAGEDFFTGQNPAGFDFRSASIAVYPAGRFQKILIGDYSMQFGQGLTLWSGFSLGKGPDVAGLAKRETGLKPYTSANESSFFRGAAVKFSLLKIFTLNSFISIRSLDASLNRKDSSAYTLSTISSSGLHRTATEIKNKGSLDQLLYGAVLEYSGTALSTGLIAYHSDYQHAFITGNPLYRRYAFTGKQLSNFGLHYSYTFRNIYFFGEAAQSSNGGIALLNGMMASLSPKVSAVILQRDYAKDYASFYSEAAGEGDTANEKGLYAGINISPYRHWKISVYADLFWFPQPKYRVDEASVGQDWMAELSYVPRKTFKASLKFKMKQNQQNDPTASIGIILAEVSRGLARIELSWKLNPKIELQNRIEITRYRKGNPAAEYGYLVYQDLAWHPISSRFSANCRLAYFNTASYQTRSYAYEDDVAGGSGSGLYNGQGLRAFLNTSYRLNKQLRIWCRYATYYYPGADSTGSGLDEIQGNKKSDFKLQLRYHF